MILPNPFTSHPTQPTLRPALRSIALKPELSPRISKQPTHVALSRSPASPRALFRCCTYPYPAPFHSHFTRPASKLARYLCMVALLISPPSSLLRPARLSIHYIQHIRTCPHAHAHTYIAHTYDPIDLEIWDCRCWSACLWSGAGAEWSVSYASPASFPSLLPFWRLYLTAFSSLFSLFRFLFFPMPFCLPFWLSLVLLLFHTLTNRTSLSIAPLRTKAESRRIECTVK